MAGSLEESEKWLAKAEQTLNAAKLLAEQGFCNEAVSRSYYAMFYAAKAAVASEGVRAKKHSAVISAFGRLFAKSGRVDPQLHRELLDAFEARDDADYLVWHAVPEEEALAGTKVAEEFVSAVKSSLFYK